MHQISVKIYRTKLNLSKQKNPITIRHLPSIMAIMPNDLDSLVYWSLITLMFFGRFRAGGLVSVPTQSSYSAPLVPDISFGTSSGKLYLRLTIKRSKVKPHGVNAIVCCPNQPLCADCNATRYLKSKGIYNTLGNTHTLCTHFKRYVGQKIKKLVVIHRRKS